MSPSNNIRSTSATKPSRNNPPAPQPKPDPDASATLQAGLKSTPDKTSSNPDDAPATKAAVNNLMQLIQSM